MYGLYVYQYTYIYIHIYGTFFWLAGQHDAAKTSMGTRPGDCFADVVFGYAWSVVLKKVETYMVEHNLIAGCYCTHILCSCTHRNALRTARICLHWSYVDGRFGTMCGG